MDATTILAVISCAIVFIGWLALPHSRIEEVEKVERVEVETRERVPVSAA